MEKHEECHWCGKDLTYIGVGAEHADRGLKFCSHDCYYDWEANDYDDSDFMDNGPVDSDPYD